MSVELHMIDPVKDDDYPFSYYDDPGAVFRCEERDNEDGESWAIVLPNRCIWFTNQRSTENNELWEVTGEAPKFSVNPSINVEGAWHGWIKNGIMDP